MGNVMVSVIMPAYNSAKYITESIASVQHQTMENWELLIVDDGSTDNTAQVIAPLLTDSRIHYYSLPEHKGAACARSMALRNAKGDFIAFLDSDDLWAPEKLERQLAFMASSDCYFSCTSYHKVDEFGNSLGRLQVPFRKAGYWLAYFTGNPIGNSTVIYDRRHFGLQQVPEIRKRNDYALWLQLLRHGDACYGLQEPLMSYRVRFNSLSARKVALLRYNWHVIRHLEKRNIFVAALGLMGCAVCKVLHLGQKREQKQQALEGMTP